MGDRLAGRAAPAKWSIRRARPTDLPHLTRIEAKSYTAPWSPEGFAALGANQSVRILVADGLAPDRRAGPIGYAVFWIVGAEAELANLAVDPRARGRGLGGALLDEVVAVAREEGVAAFYLDVRISNETAIALYLSRGFRPIATRPQYYEHPTEDATVMCLDLNATDG